MYSIQRFDAVQTRPIRKVYGLYVTAVYGCVRIAIGTSVYWTLSSAGVAVM